jgi:hypothetical protein
MRTNCWCLKGGNIDIAFAYLVTISSLEPISIDDEVVLFAASQGSATTTIISETVTNEESLAKDVWALRGSGAAVLYVNSEM